MIKYIVIIIYAFLGSVGMYLIKLGAETTELSKVNSVLNFNVSLQTIAGFICYVASFLVYMYLISKYNLSYIIPLATAFLYIFILIISIFILKEPFTLIKGIGFFLILIGVILLNIK